MNLSIANLRQDYTLAGLTEADADLDPFKQFSLWFSQAVKAQLLEPNAMTLATLNPDGHPAARIVLLKGFDERGFIFYTNYNSAKGQDLTTHPWAALVFLWKELERQVRLEGKVEPISPQESDAYFSTRPLNSQIGAWASAQSQVVSSREQLEYKFSEYEQKFTSERITRPPHWGGFRVVPHLFEFWQGRSSRLHDRLSYRLKGQNQWIRERLSP